jgi:glutamyl-tRNA synthetase
LADGARFLFEQRPLTIEPAAAALLTPEARAHLADAKTALEAVPAWTIEAIEGAVREVAEKAGLKLGKLAQPLRAALTGRTTSPGIFDVLLHLGKQESMGRISDQLEPSE